MRIADYQQRKPTADDVDRMWRDLHIERVAIESPTLHQFLNTLRSERPNGGAELACFHVGDNNVFDWFAARNRMIESGFPERFVTHSAVIRYFSELRLNEEINPNKTRRRQHGWEDVIPFEIPGQWAQSLYVGGVHTNVFAHHPDTRNQQSSKMYHLASDAFMEAVDERYADLLAYRTTDVWSEWFKALLDTSWILVDRGRRKIWILAVTDTD